MKELFDATVKQFDDKVAYERNYIEKSYEKIILDQRTQMKIYEQNTRNAMLGKIRKLDDFVQELALGQARMLERAISAGKDESRFEDNGLFPRSMDSNNTIADSVLENQVIELKMQVDKLKREMHRDKDQV